MSLCSPPGKVAPVPPIFAFTLPILSLPQEASLLYSSILWKPPPHGGFHDNPAQLFSLLLASPGVFILYPSAL